MTLTPRAALLALSGSPALRTLVTQNLLLRGMVTRFVAGETLPDALRAAEELQKRRIRTAYDFLGENVTSATDAHAATEAYIHTLQAVGSGDAYLSIKLTALGLGLSTALASDNLHAILAQAEEIGGAFVCVDMEGSAYTDRTLSLVRAAHRSYPHVGTVLQAALYRTEDDLNGLCADGIAVRLVKGAYAEPPSVAYPRKADVDKAYVRQMRKLLLNHNGHAVATHDEAILRDAKRFVRERRIPNDSFEFQMLYGIRRDLQEGLADEGYGVRAYVPFGTTWYPYFMRRLAERPANIAFLLKTVLKP